ncbi:MAG: response regulator transcription factor [Xanthomonadales bacterium]|nr:response regulator transcription factor [Xanthomonadales bacterium]
MSAPLRLLLVDDHAVVRDGLAAIMQTEPGIELVGTAGSGEEALAVAERRSCEVALVDLLLPDMDGVELTGRLCQRHPGIAVILLTSVADPQRARAALDAGARGYLLKDSGADSLISALRAAARGETVLAQGVAKSMTRDNGTHDPIGSLSLRERDVLQLIAEGRNNAEIANCLGIGETTVKTHVGNLLAKLEVSDRTQAAVFAWRHGLVKSAD